MPARKYYTYEEDQILLDGWWDSRKRDEIVEQLQGRSKNSCALRFYKLLKERGLDAVSYRAHMNSLQLEVRDFAFDEKPSILSTKRLPKEKTVEVVYGEDVDQRLDQLEEKLSSVETNAKSQNDNFVTWLENILYLYKSGEGAINMSLLTKQNYELTEKIAELEHKLNKTEERLLQETVAHEHIYNELDFWLGQFFKLSSVEKIATLQDFLPKIKSVVDSYGTVLSVKKIPLLSKGEAV